MGQRCHYMICVHTCDRGDDHPCVGFLMPNKLPEFLKAALLCGYHGTTPTMTVVPGLDVTMLKEDFKIKDKQMTKLI
jgi:hypothetical protein